MTDMICLFLLLLIAALVETKTNFKRLMRLFYRDSLLLAAITFRCMLAQFDSTGEPIFESALVESHIVKGR